MASKSNDFEKLRAKIIVRAWKDPRFKEKLLKNPRAAFKEMGLDLPENFQIKVVEDKSNTYTFVLPAFAAGGAELSEQDLERLAAGNVGATGIGCDITIKIPPTCSSKC